MGKFNNYLEVVKTKKPKSERSRIKSLLNGFRGTPSYDVIKKYLTQYGVTNFERTGKQSFTIDGEWSTFYKFTAELNGKKFYGGFDIEFGILDTDIEDIDADDYK